MRSGQTTQTYPWLALWIAPRESLRKMLARDPKRFTLLLSILNGIFSAFATLIFFKISAPEWQWAQSALAWPMALFFGALLGIFHLYFGSFLYRLTGSWLKGSGTFTEVKCAVGWGAYPMMIASILSILQALSLDYPVPALIFALLHLIITLWALILFVYFLAEAHRFSAWRALGAILLAYILLFALFLIILLSFPLLSPLFS